MNKERGINWSRMVGRSFNVALMDALMQNLSLESTNDFLMGIVECFMSVLDLDIGGWLTKKGEKITISYIVDENSRLTDEAMKEGGVFKKENTPEYLSKVWEFNTRVMSSPTSDIGVDLWIRLSPETIIFLDGSSEEVNLPNIMEELSQNVSYISRLYQEFTKRELKIGDSNE